MKLLKLTAMLLMLIDHITLVFVPHTNILYTLGRLVGRLAMPIFAYKIAIGFLHTSNFKNYVMRVILMTLCAQIPFVWMAHGLSFEELLNPRNLPLFFTNWNIGLTFICALLILKLYQGLDECSTNYPSLSIIAISLLGLLSMVADYNIYGVFMVIIFYVIIKYRYSFLVCALLIVTNTLVAYITPTLMGNWSPFLLQAFCVLSLPLIKSLPDNNSPRSQRIWYAFYPVHMLVLAFLSALFKFK